MPNQTAGGAQAVRDTIAEVFRQAEYDRSLRESLWNRLWTWFANLFRAADRALSSSDILNWTVMTVVGLAALALIGRIAYLYYVRGILIAETREGRGRHAKTGRARDPRLVAQELASAGQYTEAAHALYMALLETLARRSPIRPHPSKTVGDYVRELRARAPDLWPRFRDFARVYEVVVYGLGTCDRERYERLDALAAPILSGATGA